MRISQFTTITLHFLLLLTLCELPWVDYTRDVSAFSNSVIPFHDGLVCIQYRLLSLIDISIKHTFLTSSTMGAYTGLPSSYLAVADLIHADCANPLFRPVSTVALRYFKH